MIQSQQTDIVSTVEIWSPEDVLETLSKVSTRVTATILDPWYNKGVGGTRPDYTEWLSEVIHAAAAISDHVFVWGFPEIVAHQLSRMPKDYVLVAWLTWYYKNCPSVIRGWRSAQNTCLHLSAKDAETYPEHFLNEAQIDRLQSGKMRFVPGPPSVIEAPLNVGFVRKSEQTGHPAQKPMSVIEPLILMSTKPSDVVLDPMCGSGTTGEVCMRLDRRAILCDASEQWLDVTESRIANAGRRITGGDEQNGLF